MNKVCVIIVAHLYVHHSHAVSGLPDLSGLRWLGGVII